MAIQIADKNTFQELIAEDFVIVDFYGAACGPCKVLSRVLEDVAAEIPFLNIVKLNVTEYPELGQAYHIAAVPTVQFYRDGRLLESHVGILQAQAIKDIAAKYLYA